MKSQVERCGSCCFLASPPDLSDPDGRVRMSAKLMPIPVFFFLGPFFLFAFGSGCALGLVWMRGCAHLVRVRNSCGNRIGSTNDLSFPLALRMTTL